jgi:four helix bundle protein
MRLHGKLDVRNKAVDFVVEIYKATENFPKDERFGLTSQVRRGAVSIPANIAAGAARTSPKEFAHFLSNAQGSASEVETELLIATRLGYLTPDVHVRWHRSLNHLGKMLNGLMRYARSKSIAAL